MRDLLGHLEVRAVVPPLVALQELAANPALPLAPARDFVARQLAEATAAIDADRAAIAKLAAETAALRAETTDLKTKARSCALQDVSCL